MATENAAKKGFGARFMHWYESYQGKNVVNIVYSAGASVVIVGALFKILHWPLASQVLMVGMFTEAFLFLIGTLEHPHPEFHWENVFPQLLEYGTKPELLEAKANQPRPTLLGAGSEEGAPVSGEKGRAAVPALKDEDLQALKDGIADLAKTASQFSELGKVAQTGVKLGEKLAAAEVATSEYTTKLSAAGSATDSFAQVTNDLSGTYAQVTEDMKHVVAGTEAYKASVDLVGQKLASLNSVYELQLQAMNAHIEAIKAQAATVQTQIEAGKEQAAAVKEQVAAVKEQVDAQKNIAASAREAAEVQAAFVAESKTLKKQITDLNAVYGNMLNALA
ncbi:MAG: gliding motility protein GldL [Paludibacteraceae bacterium]|nr:gliding motility protein GldL [Paludibacteraceae bacterium]